MPFHLYRFPRIQRTSVRALFLLGLAIGSAAAAHAQTWTALPDPGVPIVEHAATLLLDGRVLVVSKSAPPLLFDPRNGTWHATSGAPGDLARSGAAAALLTDGRVLVAGGAVIPDGTTNVAALASAFLFDPATDTWTPAASLTDARYAPAIARLADGRIVVAGGRPDAGAVQIGLPWSSAEIYDPAAATWTAASGVMSTGRWGSSFIPQGDGRLLIAGGAQDDRSADLFDPATALFVPVTDAVGARVQSAGLLLPDGTTWLAGDGQLAGNSGAASTQPEIFTPPAGPWTATSPYGPVLPSAALLPDGRALIVPNGGGAGAAFFLPDGAAGSYLPTFLDHTGGTRLHPTMTVLPDGRALLLGGTANTALTAEAFDARTVATTPTASSGGATDSVGAASALLPDGRVLFAGGVAVGGPSIQRDTAALYNPATDVWQPLPPMSTPRINSPAAIVLRDGRVMVFAGSFNNAGLAIVDILDPVTNMWTAGSPLNGRRVQPATVALSNGWILTFGGVADLLSNPMTSSEMYIPELDRWMPVAPMPAPRWRMAAVRLSDDRVLVAGGIAGAGVPTDTAWIYDYRLDEWTATGSLNVARQDTQMRLLPDGRVILVSFNDPSRSEIWDPATGAWTLVPMAGTQVFDGALTMLPTGEVALISGATTVSAQSAEIKIFDPASGTWRVAGALAAGRRDPEAVVLPDGRLLVMGGNTSAGAAVSELVTLAPDRDPLRVPALDPLGTLMRDEAPAVEGEGFMPSHAGGAGIGSGSSATNQPFIAYRSLMSDEQGFLPIDAFTGTTAALRRLTGRSLGPALIDVRVNGIRSDARLAAIDAERPAADLTIPATRFSAAARAITLTAQFSSPIATPGGMALGLVTASDGTIIGVPTRPAPVGAGGVATLSYLVPAGTPVGAYTVQIVFAGDPLHAPVAATGTLQILPIATTLTLTPTPATVARGGTVQMAASVAPAEGEPVTGTIALASAAGGCAVAAPAGSCELTFPQLGPIAVSGTFTPAASGTHTPASAQTMVQVTCPDITLTPLTLPIGRAGEPYSVTLEASGGLAPYTFAASGALPAGLSWTGATLSGTPAAAFDGTLTVRAHEAGDACQGVQTYALTIEPLPGAREYTLAEGASNGFFSTFILVANPNATAAPITLTYVGEQGAAATETRTLAPFSRTSIATGDGSIAAQAGPTFATRIVSEQDLPLVIERATYFDGALHAGDLSSAAEGSGSTAWHFAEGANGFFHTYLTLGNLQASETAAVTVRYLPESGPAFERPYSVAPHSRTTIDTAEEPALASGAFAMTVTASVPIAADRVQYFGHPFIGAHADSGARALSRDWYFAEGASGSSFATYLLLANPSASDAASVTVTFHTETGAAIERTTSIPAGARRSLDAAAEDPRLVIGTFWIEVHADRPIVAERAMYLVGRETGTWIEATATTGTPAPGLRWGLAEGVTGMAPGYAPYLLIANPGQAEARIVVQYLRAAGEPLSHDYRVPPQGRLTLDIRGEEPSLADAAFSIIVSSTNDVPIVVERSQYWTLGGTGFVGAMNTMGTPLPPAVPPQP